MLRLLRSILQLIFLAVAITILYPHAEAIWYAHSVVGWGDAISKEWAKARLPMLAGIIVVVIAIAIEVIIIIQERKESIKTKEESIKTNRLLEAIAKKLDIDSDEYRHKESKSDAGSQIDSDKGMA